MSSPRGREPVKPPAGSPLAVVEEAGTALGELDPTARTFQRTGGVLAHRVVLVAVALRLVTVLHQENQRPVAARVDADAVTVDSADPVGSGLFDPHAVVVVATEHAAREVVQHVADREGPVLLLHQSSTRWSQSRRISSVQMSLMTLRTIWSSIALPVSMPSARSHSIPRIASATECVALVFSSAS